MIAAMPHAGALGTFRPRFIRELAVVPGGDALIVDGTERLQVLEGEATRSALPRLIALMDGSRTVEELEAALPDTPAERIRGAVRFLQGSGLVEDAAGEPATGAVDQNDTLAFCRRFISATRVNRSGREAYDKLRAAQVVVVDAQPDGPHAAALGAELDRAGIGHVTILDRGAAAAWLSRSHDVAPLVVSFTFGEEPEAWHEELDRLCASNEIDWLRAVVHEQAGYADIGPRFDAELGACYRCFRRVHGRASARQSAEREGDLSRRSAEREGGAIQLWASMVAVEVAYQASRLGPLLAGRGFHRYDLRTWRSAELRHPRVPGCSRCRPTATPTPAISDDAEATVDTGVVFEDYMGLPSRIFLEMRAQPDPGPAGRGSMPPPKRLAVCALQTLTPVLPRLEAGTFDVMRGEGPRADGPIALDALAAVLRMTAGIRDSRGPVVKRWAATAGNLGSVELFVAARDVTGLAPGLYAYDAEAHALARIERRRAVDSIGAASIDTFMRRAIPGDHADLPDVLVLLTGAYHRLARKYGPFGYRLTNLDAGTAVAQLEVVAGCMGIHAELQHHWADNVIADAVDLEPFDEQVTAVVALSRVSRVPARERAEPPASTVRPSSAKPPLAFADLSPGDVVRMLHDESRVHDCDLRVHSHAPVTPRDDDRRATRTVRLPMPARDGRSVGRMLADRHTIRHYTADPVTLEPLATMLQQAHRADAAEWAGDHRAGVPLEYWVIAGRVDGLPHGVYRYDADAHALAFERDAIADDDVVAMLTQEEYASAPVLVVIAANLAGACARYGAWGHRQLLLRAGAAGHRLWMAGLASGLAGSIFAGLVPGAVRRHLGFDGYARAGLFAFTAGHAAKASSPSSPLMP